MDHTDEQERILEPLLPMRWSHLRRPSVDLREVVNALLSLFGPGCRWRGLPHDLLAGIPVLG